MQSVPHRLRHKVLSHRQFGGRRGYRYTRHRAACCWPLLFWELAGGPYDGRQHLPGQSSSQRHFCGGWPNGDLPSLHHRLVSEQKWREPFSGDVHNLRSYYAYGQPVYAVADAPVLIARDGHPDNVPGPVETFPLSDAPIRWTRLRAIKSCSFSGTAVIHGTFTFSRAAVPVKPGGRVRRGQPLGRIECSGGLQPSAFAF